MVTEIDRRAFRGVWIGVCLGRAKVTEMDRRAFLEQSLGEVDMSVRALRVLRNLGCVRMADVVRLPRGEVIRVRGVGKKTLKELDDLLAVSELSFGMSDTEIATVIPDKDASVPESTVATVPDLSVHEKLGRVKVSEMDRRAFLEQSFEEVDMSVRASNVLLNLGCARMADVVRLARSDVLSAWGVGRKTLTEIEKLLAANGLRLEMADAEIYAFTPDSGATIPASTNPTVPDLSVQEKVQLSRRLANFDLSTRVTNALRTLRLVYVGDLVRLRDDELLRVPRFGRKSLTEVSAFLQGLGLKLGMALPDWDEQQAKAWRNQYASELKQVARDEIVSSVTPATSLEDELRLTVIRSGARGREELLISHYGWDGRTPETLEVTGKRYGLTRERVRQIRSKFERHANRRALQLPLLDGALEVISSEQPALCDQVSVLLQKHGLTTTRIPIEAIVRAADVFGRNVSWRVKRVGNTEIVAEASVAHVLRKSFSKARTLIANRGYGHIEQVLEILPLDARDFGSRFVRDVFSREPDLTWLDDERNWFTVLKTSRNRLRRILRVVLAVARRIRIGELRTAVKRDVHMRGVAPPKHILLEICKHQPFCTVEGDTIIASERLKAEEVLAGSQRLIWEVFRDNGPLLRFHEYRRIGEEAGLGPSSISVSITFCLIIARVAPAIYALVGANVGPADIMVLAPPGEKEKVLRDSGWTESGEFWCGYRLSDGAINLGMLSVPGAMKDKLDGKYAVQHVELPKIMEVKIGDGQMRGMQSAFRALGCEPGDYVVVRVNLQSATLTLEFGDELLLEHYALPNTSPKSDHAAHPGG